MGKSHPKKLRLFISSVFFLISGNRAFLRFYCADRKKLMYIRVWNQFKELRCKAIFQPFAKPRGINTKTTPWMWQIASTKETCQRDMCEYLAAKNENERGEWELNGPPGWQTNKTTLTKKERARIKGLGHQLCHTATLSSRSHLSSGMHMWHARILYLCLKGVAEGAEKKT